MRETERTLLRRIVIEGERGNEGLRENIYLYLIVKGVLDFKEERESVREISERNQ